MKKILIFTLAALLSVFFIDRSYSKHNQAVIQQMLIDEIETQNQHETVTVDFRRLFDFKWDKVYVFTPQTSLKTIDETLGFQWFEAKSAKAAQKQEMELIVFVENNQVAQYILLPIEYGNLAPVGENGTFIVNR